MGGNDWGGNIKNSYATGAVTGTNAVGGLVGLVGLVGLEGGVGTIENSYATGAVTGTTDVGGLVGWNAGGLIKNSHATGTVSETTLGTGTNVGGLVGWNAWGTINRSYATGAVSGTTSVGGLVGWNDQGTINASFWDTDTTGLTTGVGLGVSDGATGKTTLKMLRPSTFTGAAGWCYATVWAQVYVTGISLTPSPLELTVGGSPQDLTAAVLPADRLTYPYLQWQQQQPATWPLAPTEGAGKDFTWTLPGDESVVSVTYVGTTATVTPVAIGTTTIRVTTDYSGHTTTCDVIVSEVPVTGVTLLPKTMRLTAGGRTGQLIATVSPENATDKTVTWTSSDETVASVVYVGTTATVTSGVVGTATITVTTICGKYDTCVVTVVRERRGDRDPTPPDEEEKLFIELTVGQLPALVYGAPYELLTEPYIQEGTDRTMVPLRFVSEALGAEVEWWPETQQVFIKDGETELILTVGSDQVLVNGTPITMDTWAELIYPPGRVFVPLRFVSETLGAQVTYDEETKHITVTR